LVRDRGECLSNYLTVHEIIASVQTNKIWDNFKIKNSPGDGHCLLHSISTSFNAQLFTKIKLNSMQTLIGKLINETIQQRKTLREVTFGSDIVLFSLLDQYVLGKNYNNIFCDIVPDILSNALAINFIIIDERNGSFQTYIIGKEEVNKPYILIHKNGDHYNAIVPKGNTKLSKFKLAKVKHVIKNDHIKVNYQVFIDKRKKNETKILFLNVNGLHSKINLNVFESYIKPFDIVCLSETKTKVLQDEELNGFKIFMKKTTCKSHRYGGIHGLCILVKEDIAPHCEIVDECNSNSILWIKLNKQAIGFDCLICAIYLPCEGSIHHKSDFFDRIYSDIVNLNTKYNYPILLLGDFNSRTGILNDFITIEDSTADAVGIDLQENDIFNVKSELENLNISVKRYNSDKKTNNNGVKLIELCKDMNIKIVNGRFGADEGKGDFTCKDASTIDYAIASPCILKQITDFSVDIFDPSLSDCHRPICLSIKHNCAFTQTSTVSVHSNSLKENVTFDMHRTNWNVELATNYKNMFDENEINELNNTLDNSESSEINQFKIDEITHKLKDIFFNPSFS
jgi:hypothetical protein